jgi:ABC-type branched-subunit amino acid transport system ATPase component/ABC-type branched-subunit amino acid transport system permease subunit
MLPAFVAGLIGGLASVPGALVGAFVVGAAQGMVPAFTLVPGLRSFASQVGLPQLVLTVLALAVMYLRGQRFSTAEKSGSLGQVATEIAPRSAYDPELTAPTGGRVRILRFVILAALVAWPFAHFPGFLPVDRFSLLGDATLALQYFLVAASLVMLTGWVGQISLAQGSLVGIGAFGAALVARHMELPFPTGLIVSGVVAAGVAAMVGLVALRVRGLYLAVATLIVAWMADEYLFVVPWFAGTGGSATLDVKPAGRSDAFPFFDFTDRRSFYFVMLAVAAMVFFGLLNLRDSKSGRAFAAVRGSETAAASLGINVVRTKLFAFCLAGLIAGIGGNLIITNQQTVTPDQFGLQGNQGSLILLAIAVVGGLRSLNGAIASAAVFAGLNELVFRVPSLGRYFQLVSAGLLALILLFYPGGLAALPADVRRFWRRLVPAKQADRPTAAADVSAEEVPDEMLRPEVVDITRKLATREAARSGPVLEAEGITVRFGGLVAVDGASLEVRAGQIVGLIGPNGAGKTTLFNAISGLNSPTAGRVQMFGEDVTDQPVHLRAARGLGRTFQVIQLFPELTVFENLLVATHLHNPTGPLSHIVATAKAIRAELDAEDACRDVVRFLDLADIADRPVAGLPFGTLRMVELGRALVTGAPIVMLDEPASGLDNVETDRLAEVLLRVRSEMSLSILLIEHDVRMVTSTSDYMYVLDRGHLIAQGTPAEVQRDPAVVTAYLGEPVAEAVS